MIEFVFAAAPLVLTGIGLAAAAVWFGECRNEVRGKEKRSDGKEY